MTEFLNDVEKAAVQAFHDNQGMFETVKKVLVAAIYENGVLVKGKPAEPFKNAMLTFVNQNPGATNEQVGADLRAKYQGLLALEQGFSYIASLKKVEPKKATANRAR